MGAQVRRRRVTKSPMDRREDILRGGREVFGSIGFAAATIGDLAAAADIGKGTFYLYYESKDHLLGALWERYVDAIASTAQDILEEGGDWWPTLDRLFTELVGHAVRNADLHSIVYGSANAKALEICKQANQRVIDLICEYVGRGARAGALQAGDPAATLRMVYHGVDGLLDDLIAAGGPIDVDKVVADVLDLLHRALAGPAR
ncbi:TetR/AcrR family transcriptional regulator [Actinomadura xylanilytica]|uniref:TetR/AcrR family transcriptional regulator n=1 Tax=Actinomadura xylanilytica TaxID=887459 RepID=UPI00255AF514|nr:TetR/AcrR family transcriptional regulator [Actinomadura xylanilytica]MDL4775143.1 TetR/AcrR family transcriptional regulator [Actinomadura xylanilytica]